MQQFFAVLFVLSSLCGAVLFLRKKGIADVNGTRRKQGSCLRQLERMRLTPQHSIHLLQVEDHRILIAVHPQGVTILEKDRRQPADAGKHGAIR